MTKFTDIAAQTHNWSGSTLGEHQDYLATVIKVKKAAALANSKSKEISNKECQSIVSACDKLITNLPADKFPVEVYGGGGGIAIHLNVCEVLVEETGLAMEVINRSQSTTDVLHTAGRIALRKKIGALLDSVELLTIEIQKKADLFADQDTIARTCLRDANPGKVGDLFSGHAAVYHRIQKKLFDQIVAPLAVNLGGTATGSGIGAKDSYRKHILETLGEVFEAKLVHRDNFYDATQNSDDLGEFASILRLLASHGLKVAQDLRFLYSGPLTGLSEITLPTQIPGSLFFADKSNPTVPETFMMACFTTFGHGQAVQSSISRSELNYNPWDSYAVHTLLQATWQFTRALDLFRKYAIVDLNVNNEVSDYYAKHHKSRKDATHDT